MIYLITDRTQFPSAPTNQPQLLQQLSAIELAVKAGCQLVQIREKDLEFKELCNLTTAAIAAARPQGARMLVNDRLDVALATRADGVHLRSASLNDQSKMREIKQHQLLVGASTHSLAEAMLAQAAGADFLVCGPVFPPRSKIALGAPLGLQNLAEICQAITIPVLALGGITFSNFMLPLQHGAAGIAGISLFNDTSSLGKNINMMLSSELPTTRLSIS